MGGTKATIDDLRAAFRATTTVTIDRIASDKDRVGVDVAWSQLAILVIMLVCSTRLTLDLVCAHTHTHTVTSHFVRLPCVGKALSQSKAKAQKMMIAEDRGSMEATEPAGSQTTVAISIIPRQLARSEAPTACTHPQTHAT